MESIINAALSSLPAILALIRSNRAAVPGETPPTDAEVIAGLHSAVASVVAKGELWKSQHPAHGDTGE